MLTNRSDRGPGLQREPRSSSTAGTSDLALQFGARPGSPAQIMFWLTMVSQSASPWAVSPYIRPFRRSSETSSSANECSRSDRRARETWEMARSRSSAIVDGVAGPSCRCSRTATRYFELITWLTSSHSVSSSHSVHIRIAPTYGDGPDNPPGPFHSFRAFCRRVNTTYRFGEGVTAASEATPAPERRPSDDGAVADSRSGTHRRLASRARLKAYPADGARESYAPIHAR